MTKCITSTVRSTCSMCAICCTRSTPTYRVNITRHAPNSSPRIVKAEVEGECCVFDLRIMLMKEMQLNTVYNFCTNANTQSNCYLSYDDLCSHSLPLRIVPCNNFLPFSDRKTHVICSLSLELNRRLWFFPTMHVKYTNPPSEFP